MQPFWGIAMRVSLLVLLLLAAAASPRDPARGGRRLLPSHGTGVEMHSSRARSWGNNNVTTLVERINNEVQCWMSNGEWRHSSEASSIVERSCLQFVRYSEGPCHSTAFENSTHRHQVNSNAYIIDWWLLH